MSQNVASHNKSLERVANSLLVLAIIIAVLVLAVLLGKNLASTFTPAYVAPAMDADQSAPYSEMHTSGTVASATIMELQGTNHYNAEHPYGVKLILTYTTQPFICDESCLSDIKDGDVSDVRAGDHVGLACTEQFESSIPFCKLTTWARPLPNR